MPTTRIQLSLVILLLAVGLDGQTGPTKQRLDNGLEIYHMPLSGSEFVSLALVFDAGPSHQAPGQSGLSRLAANFINTSPIAATGTILETHLWSEGYSLVIASSTDSVEQVIEALAFVFDRVQADDNEFIAIQNQVNAWIERAYDRSVFRAQRGLIQALWGDQWQRKDPLGDFRVVSALRREEIVAWSSRFIVPHNCVLIVVGDLDSDQLTECIAGNLAKLPVGENAFIGAGNVTFP